MKNITKNLIASGIILAGSVFGCGIDKPKTIYNGYEIEEFHTNGLRAITMRDTLNEDKRIHAVDRGNTGRFNELQFYIPEGHPLWTYANQDSLEKVYKTVIIQKANEVK